MSVRYGFVEMIGVLDGQVAVVANVPISLVVMPYVSTVSATATTGVNIPKKHFIQLFFSHKVLFVSVSTQNATVMVICSSALAFAILSGEVR